MFARRLVIPLALGLALALMPVASAEAAQRRACRTVSGLGPDARLCLVVRYRLYPLTILNHRLCLTSRYSNRQLGYLGMEDIDSWRSEAVSGIVRHRHANRQTRTRCWRDPHATTMRSRYVQVRADSDVRWQLWFDERVPLVVRVRVRR